ncbi:MAG: ABC transporter ATP-binding protein, partial [Tissierellia bacterium]|nr:ABC transporter ATP-binding protein [Tissierellia bacterium]
MKHFFKYMKPYWKKAVLTIIFTFINVLSVMILPSLMADIVNVGVIRGDTDIILSKGIVMILVTLIGTLVMILASYYSSDISTKVATDVRHDLFKKAESLSISQMDEVGVSSLITRTTNDVDMIRMITQMGLRMMARTPLMFISGIVMAFSKSPQLSILLLIAMPFLAIFIFLVGKKAIPLFKVNQEKVDNMNRVLRENITGVRVVRAFDKKDYEMERFGKTNVELRELNLHLNRIMSLLSPGIYLFLNAMIIFVIHRAVKQIDLGYLEIGDLMAFTQYIFMILFSVVLLSMILIMIPRGEVSAKRIHKILSMEDKIIVTDDGDISDGPVSLEFKDVSFRFDDAEEYTIEDLSFQAKAGDTVAIIGGTGTGKSTVANLILRFYDISKGSIKVNGLDIRQWNLKALRQKIGHVPQKAQLFSGTIASNLKKGKSDAKEDEMRRALEISQSMEFVEEYEDGLDHPVAQNGSNFSGGQKQRLSIARAIVRDPEIYIFDDSFSALDFKTEKNLQNQLKKETKKAIRLIVAQKISTVENTDLIIVLDDDHVDGIGKHEQLLETSPVYREIYESQR